MTIALPYVITNITINQTQFYFNLLDVQPTSTSFMRDMATLGIEQIFTYYDNPKGNADTERVMRTIKEEVLWLNEFSSLEEAREKIGQWIEIDYNKFYVHSGLGYLSPEEYEALYNQMALRAAA